jgi:hypothetical protein
MNRFLRLMLAFARYALPLILASLLIATATQTTTTATQTDDGLLYTSETGRFDITMPMPISLHEETVTYSFDLHQYAQLSGASLECHQLGAKDYGAVWFVVYCDYPPEAFAQLTPDQILDYARDSTFTSGVSILKDEADITFDNRFPGRAFIYERNGGETDLHGKTEIDTYKARAYVADNRLYWVGAWVIGSEQDNRLSKVDPFLDSFYIENPA